MTFDERTEKNIATLLPAAQKAARAFMAAAALAMESEGVTVKVISGTRTYAEQDALFAKRPKVTNARGGYSNHNFGIAWDIGLFKDGRYLEESPLYRVCGRIGREQGLEWGGDWRSLVDEPHFQLRTGVSLAEMRLRVLRGDALL